MNYEFEIHPRDILYFRDGRPLGGSSDGWGAAWPHPALFHSALLGMLQNRFSDRIGEWESVHKHPTAKELKRRAQGKGVQVRHNFGGLKTWGPFPKNGQGIFVPTPADLLAQGKIAAPMKFSKNGMNNLPKPLKYPVGSLIGATKEKPGAWILLGELPCYLKGETGDIKTVPADQLYLSEARPGIGIEPERRSAAESKFYSAEYLRTERDVVMAAFASCTAKKYDGTKTDVFEELFRERSSCDFLFGGQRGTAQLECCRGKNLLPEMTETSFPGNRVKWVLLSPGCFSGGWLPGWVDRENGNVLLKEGKTDAVNAQLVAACVPKPITISGWNPAVGAPKATRLLVPAGSVYYFECNTQEDAQRLYRILYGKTKSDALGEQGLGLGICGEWNYIE